MSLVRQNRERILAAGVATVAATAAAQAVAIGRAGGTFLGSRLAAHLEATGGEIGPRAAALAMILLQLQEDRARLKGIQSVVRKIDLKRELLPRYDAWVSGILEAGDGVQDEVLATVMVWRIDVGDYAGALPLAAHVLRHGFALPDQFERQPAVLIAEEIADAAIAAIADDREFSAEILNEVALLTQPHDMPDQVRAKVHKALGLELASRLDKLAENGVAGARRAGAVAALAEFKQAFALNPKAGVVKDIQALERELKNTPADPAADAATAAATITDAAAAAAAGATTTTATSAANDNG